MRKNMFFFFQFVKRVGCTASALGLFVLLGGSNLWAQLESASNMVQTPTPGSGHDYIKLVSETVNPANGGVSIRIGLPIPPGRGVTIPFAIAYDSGNVLEMRQGVAPGYAQWMVNRRWLAQGGWSYTVPMVSAVPNSRLTKIGTYCDFLSNFMFEDPTGGQHSLAISPAPPDNDQNCMQADVTQPHSFLTGHDDFYQATTPDGGIDLHYLQFSPVTIADADGTIYSSTYGTLSLDSGKSYAAYVTSIKDRNGNQIGISPGPNEGQTEGVFSYTDDVVPGGGTRTLLSSSGFGTLYPSGDTITIPGLPLAGLKSYTVKWRTITAAFPLGQYESYPATDLLSYTYFQGLIQMPGCGGLRGGGGQIKVISEIDLPNGQSYVFHYDVDGFDPPNPGGTQYGLISSIHYPDGGYVQYQWKMSPLYEFVSYADAQLKADPGEGAACGATYTVPVVAQRTVYDGINTNGALIQTFDYSTSPTPFQSRTWGIKYTTVKGYDQVRNPGIVPPSGSVYDIIQYHYVGAVGPQQPNVLGHSSAQIAVEAFVAKGTSANPNQEVTNKLWWDPYLLACEDHTSASGLTTMIYHFYGASGQNSLPGAGAQETERDEFGFGSVCGPQLPDRTNLPTGLKRQTLTQYADVPSYQGFFAYPPFNAYPFPPSQPGYVAAIFDKPSIVTVGPDSNPVDIVAKSIYSVNTANGNITGISRSCLNSWCTDPLTASYQYDGNGKLTFSTDPGGQQTQYAYDSNDGCNGAYVSMITYPPTSNGAQHILKFGYDCPSGSVIDSYDQAQSRTGYSYLDILGRLTGIIYPDGGSTGYSYHDTALPSIDTTNGGTVSSTTTFDGLGRPIQSKLTTDPEGPVFVDTTYDGEGRKDKVFNPYRSTQGPFTEFFYDGADRLIQTNNPDTPQTHSSMSFLQVSGLDCAKITDEVLNIRELCNNSLGQLSLAVEDPNTSNYPTNYTNDILGNLTDVTQGAQTRHFDHDSFSRLRRAQNPENGTITYTYGEGATYCGGDRSSPCTRADGLGNTTTYKYDEDNRLLSKTYSDTSTIRACFAYDGPNGWGNTMTNTLGHLTSSWGLTNTAAVVSGYETFTWDAMGRPVDQMQCTPSTCGTGKSYFTHATYDILGNETSFWDSSVARYSTYDNANRLVGMKASPGVPPGTPGPGSLPLINITAHSPFGGLTTATLGSSSFAETRAYNSRGWLGSFLLKNGATTVYSLSGPDTGSLIKYAGNGNVTNIIDNIDGTWAYSYDSLNRLKEATTSGGPLGTHDFKYFPDRYGNMYCTNTGALPCTGTLGATSFNTSTNRITADGIHVYDNGVSGGPGNLTADGTHGYVYDLEGRITCVVDPQGGSCSTGGATNYYYDPNGTRIAKWQGQWGQVGGVLQEEYVYDFAGDQVSAHNSAGILRNEFYAPGGRHMATYIGNSIDFNLADWLGTERVRISSAGTIINHCTDTPYGMNLTCLGPDPSPMHFTGKQRDYESGLDDFGARYNSSSIGRFMSPDLVGGHLEDPQTLNKYAYVRNNPVTLTDPTGLDFYLSCQKQSGTCGKDAAGNLVQGTTTTTTDANGNPSSTFTPTVVTSASLQDPNSGNTGTVNANGVQITTANGQTSQGIFINGTPSADLKGSGPLGGFLFHVTGSDEKSGNLDYGSYTFTGSRNQADVVNLLGQRGAWQYSAEKLFGNPKHSGELNFRFSTGAHPELFDYGPSLHVLVSASPKATVPVGPGYTGNFHIDSHTGDISHGACAWLSVGCQ